MHLFVSILVILQLFYHALLEGSFQVMNLLILLPCSNTWVAPHCLQDKVQILISIFIMRQKSSKICPKLPFQCSRLSSFLIAQAYAGGNMSVSFNHAMMCTLMPLLLLTLENGISCLNFSTWKYYSYSSKHKKNNIFPEPFLIFVFTVSTLQKHISQALPSLLLQ